MKWGWALGFALAVVRLFISRNFMGESAAKCRESFAPGRPVT
jgi:hypothetical protein